MNKKLILFAFLLGGLGFLVLAQSGQESKNYPDPKEYAPNFWFDSEESYYPTNPLDFYYDEELNELGGKEARAAYDALSQDEKLKNFRVFYNIEDSDNELVYQYWLFYVFNDSDNEHYGDWESVFVFVDGESRNISRVVASAHLGSDSKIIFGNDESSDASIKNSRILVEEGSHANCIDGDPDGLFNRFKDSRNKSSYCFLMFFSWSQADKLHGLKVEHDSPYYDLRPISEIKDVFGKKYGEERPLISKEKSPTLGRLSIKIGAKKMHALPLGGDPPQNAWLKREYKNPQEVVPLTPSRLAKAIGEGGTRFVNKVGGFVDGIGSAIASASKAIASSITNLFTASVGENFNVENNPEDNLAQLSVGAEDVRSTNTLTNEDLDKSVSENTIVGLETTPQKTTIIPSLSLRLPKADFAVQASSIVEQPAVQELRDYDMRGRTPTGGSTPTEPTESEPELETELAFVKKVIDGDTIELASGQRVRYIGIDAPEDLLECYAEEAKNHNKGLLEEKQVILLSRGQTPSGGQTPTDLNMDKYGRLLRFIWLDFYQDGKIDSADTFVNLDLVERGYAREDSFGQTHEYEHRFESAEAEAKRQGIGLWGSACNEKAETVKETGRDIIQAVEKIVDDLRGLTPFGGQTPILRPFEIAANVFKFPAPSSGGPAPTPVPTPTPTPTPTPEPAKRIVINEIQTGDSEFVELYNPASSTTSLSGYYFSYYSSTKTVWNDPWRNQPFPSGANIPSNGYYLIGLKDYPTSGGNPNADWQPYTSVQLGNTAGTIAIFSFDPSATTSESAYANRQDAVGWGTGINLYEQSTTTAPNSGKSITRNSSHNDTDNNSNDFSQAASSTPINSKGIGYDPNFSYAPLWQMYQKDSKHFGLTTLAGPSWSSSSEATSSWTFSMESTGGSQPVIDYEGTIYATDGAGNVYAIKKDGTQKWKFDPKIQGGNGAGWASASPALSSDSSRIYSTYTDTSVYKLVVYSIKTFDGLLDWKYSPSESGYNQTFTSSVLDSNGNIYVASNTKLYSISPSGSLRWEFTPTSQFSSSAFWIRNPVTAKEGANEYAYITAQMSNNSGDRYLFKVDVSNGTKVWQSNPDMSNALFNGVSINATGTIYTGGNLNIGTSGLFAISPTDGSKIWSNNMGDSLASNIPSYDASGNIFLGTEDTGNIGALHKTNATGTLLWTFTPDASPSAVQYPSVIDGQGRVYVGAKNKFVYALTPENGSIIWKYQLADEPRGFAVGNGKIYVVSYDGKVYGL